MSSNTIFRCVLWWRHLVSVARLKAWRDRIVSKIWRRLICSLPPTTLSLVVPVLHDRLFIVWSNMHTICHCMHVAWAVCLNRNRQRSSLLLFVSVTRWCSSQGADPAQGVLEGRSCPTPALPLSWNPSVSAPLDLVNAALARLSSH